MHGRTLAMLLCLTCCSATAAAHATASAPARNPGATGPKGVAVAAERAERIAMRVAGREFGCVRLVANGRAVSVRVVAQRARRAVLAALRDENRPFVTVDRVAPRYSLEAIRRVRQEAERLMEPGTGGESRGYQVSFSRRGVPGHRCPGVAIYLARGAADAVMARALAVQRRFGPDRVRLYPNQDAFAT